MSRLMHSGLSRTGRFGRLSSGIVGRAFLAPLSILVSVSCGGTRDLEWQEAEHYRWADLPVDRNGRDGFSHLPPSRTGVTFANTITEEQAMLNEHL